MAENTKIEWATHTFNPWRGCTKVSKGCANCYAETQSKRNVKTLGMWGPNGTRVVASESMWKEPLKWDRKAKESGERHRVFCASFADVFEDWQGPMVDSKGSKLHHGLTLSGQPWRWVTIDQETDVAPITMQDVRNRLFDLIDQTPNLDWLLLTKRPQNIKSMMPILRSPGAERVVESWPRNKNVWLGTSVEDQETADARIPHLLDVPAKVRFLSVEPLLGPVDLTRYDVDGQYNPRMPIGVDWVIVGGESGPNARPCNVEWIRDIVGQCKDASVPCFVKQLGSVWSHSAVSQMAHDNVLPSSYFRTDSNKGGDMDEWPEDLRVREMPQV